MRRMVVGSVVFSVFALIACGKGGATNGSSGSAASAVKDEGFDRACTTDDDCVVATFGDTCGMCPSSNAAIAKSAEPAWQKAYNRAHASCPPDDRVGKCAARYGISRCNEAKTCTYVECAESPVNEHRCTSDGDGATDVKDTFSHACATDDDCTLVSFGGTCGICGGDSRGAIAKKDRDAYQKAYNDARAHCPPAHVVGDCAFSYGVSQCSAGKCTYVRCPGSAPKDEHHCRADGGS